MSYTQRSTQLSNSQEIGSTTSRQLSDYPPKQKKKGISLSKEHDSKQRDKSPSFIKVIQKNKKKLMVERREIKLLVRAKNEPTPVE